MPQANYRSTTVAVFAILTVPQLIHAQRPTIPEAVRQGAVNSIATTPSGQPPTVADLLSTTDIVVMGTIGDSRSYLSDDQRDVYTDYPIKEPVVLFRSDMERLRGPG